jgi:hypothetical protein
MRFALFSITLKSGFLLFGIDQFMKAIPQLHAGQENLNALNEAFIIGTGASQGGHKGRIAIYTGQPILPEERLDEIAEQQV